MPGTTQSSGDTTTTDDSPVSDDAGEAMTGRPVTWGYEVLAAANFTAAEMELDKVVAEWGAHDVTRPQLRNALSDAVDLSRVDRSTALELAAEQHDLPLKLLRQSCARCSRAAEQQYPNQI